MFGKSLVIVESPSKAKTISKFLGAKYHIEASNGHIRDLPKGTKDLPEKYKKESWARLGVNVDKDFEPIYIISDEKAKLIKKLKTLLKEVDSLYLATDEDREGEAISWHLFEILKPKVPVYRLVFHEITEGMIKEALKTPRQIDEDLVRAQEARRIVDRLYGYEISPLLWYKVRSNLSAGRVQSVAVRLIVERERERISFKNAEYWDILGNFANQEAQNLQADLFSVGDRQIPTRKDFDPNTGKITNSNRCILNEQEARELANRLQNEKAFVDSVEEKAYFTHPYPPFTTSTMQQEANRKLGFTARRTMSVAQSLYENGYITYMRTDSTNLSSEAINAARSLVVKLFGAAYLPDSPRIYQTKVKNAQEAHEAIRPAGSVFAIPDTIQHKLSADEFRLYDLIWKRTLACQMTDSRMRRKSISITMDDAKFHVSGKRIDFPGYLRAYVEGTDDPDAEIADQEIVLPDVKEGEVLDCHALNPQQHVTMPPVRYSEAAMVKALEAKGIGRPSTYASIFDTILNRNYGFKKNGAIVPTWTAFAVCQLLETHFQNLVDYQFTAEMENELDAISRGELQYLDYLRVFYFGPQEGTDYSKEDNAQLKVIADEFPTGLKVLAESKASEIDARTISQVFIGNAKNENELEEPVYVRVGRYGPFIQFGERQVSIPDDLPPDELSVEMALKMVESSARAEEPLGFCPETGKPIYVKKGRFGPYIQRGDNDDEEKPQNASLLKSMNPEKIDLQTALALLKLPRHLGVNPSNNEKVLASNGRFGPFVKCGEETRSLTADLSPLDITLEKALEILAQPRGGRSQSTAASAKKNEPIRVFEDSPVTGQKVQIMVGRFGPYLTDGATNVSLNKSINQEELTFSEALEMLQVKAEKDATSPKRGRRAAKKSVKKSAKKSVKKTEKSTEEKAPKKTAKKSAKKASTKKTAKKAAKKSSVKSADAVKENAETDTEVAGNNALES